MATVKTHRSAFSIRTPPVWAGARIGLMGGSFNPPHDGHLVVARTSLRRLRLDQLWWVVTPGNPLKSHGGLPATDSRVKAVEALAKHPKMITTAFERDLGTPYTAATIEFLLNRYPHARFVWVMGADNLATFHRWQRWRDIAAMVPIAVIDRPGWRFPGLSSPAARSLALARIREENARFLPFRTPPAWVFLTTRLSNQSSTALRNQVAQ